MQRIAEDLEGRDDGKAKEAPKSKLQTRRGASRYLRRCSSCYTDAGTGYCGSEGRHGYRVHVHVRPRGLLHLLGTKAPAPCLDFWALVLLVLKLSLLCFAFLCYRAELQGAPGCACAVDWTV